MSISALQSNAIGQFSQATSEFGKASFRSHALEAPTTTDTVSASPIPSVSDADADTMLASIQGFFGNQRADALAAHGGLDLSRVMKLLE